MPTTPSQPTKKHSSSSNTYIHIGSKRNPFKEALSAWVVCARVPCRPSKCTCLFSLSPPPPRSLTYPPKQYTE